MMRVDPWLIAFLTAITYTWYRGTIFDSVRNWRKARDENEAELWWYTQGGESSNEFWSFCAKPIQRFARVWRELANCPLCSGFWIGVFGFTAAHYVPWFIRIVGVGALVGTLALAVCGVIRRL